MLAAVAAAYAGAGCGGTGTGGGAVQVAGEPGQAGALAWALPERPRTLDPLFARSEADQLAARQIYEPLVEELTGPFGDTRRLSGLALSVSPSPDRTVWRVRLRPGVRFQDGTPLNASAVLANAHRWLASEEGTALLGELLVDAPRPDQVRFILPRPDPAFGRVLASPRLGIVSPRALDAAAGGALEPSEAESSGTGAFELRERDPDRLLLARNTAWWGAGRGLGPGVDQLELLAVPGAAQRAALLRDGTVQVASELGAGQLADVRRDPLLTVIGEGRRPGLAVERSVRGIPAADPVPSLNAAWRTGIEAG